MFNRVNSTKFPRAKTPSKQRIILKRKITADTRRFTLILNCIEHSAKRIASGSPFQALFRSSTLYSRFSSLLSQYDSKALCCSHSAPFLSLPFCFAFLLFAFNLNYTSSRMYLTLARCQNETKKAVRGMAIIMPRIPPKATPQKKMATMIAMK